MGTVRVDLHRKERQYEETFPMHTPAGIEVFLENYRYVQNRRLKGDLDASLLLIDFERTLAEAPLTNREHEALYWRYMREMTERETAKILDISIRSVNKHCHRAILKIAVTVAVQEGYKNARYDD